MTGQRRAVPPAACTAALVLAIATAGPLVATGSASADDGLGSLSAREITRRAHDALFSVHSLHLSTRGRLSRTGAQASVDLTLDRAANCRGSVSLGKQGSVETIKRGNTVWIKPDQTFWKHRIRGGSATAKFYAGHYLKGSAKRPPLRDMAQVCDLDAFLNATARRHGTTPVKLTKGKETKLHEVSVIPVRAVAGGRMETLYVATHGKPYPIQLSIRDRSAETTVRFSDFNKPVPSKTPSADQTIESPPPERQPGPIGAA